MVVPRLITIEIIGEEGSFYNDASCCYYIKSIYSDGEKYKPKTAIPRDTLQELIHKNKPVVMDSRKYTIPWLSYFLNYNLKPLPKEFFAYNEKVDFNNNDNC
jgi:hypothetical protein